MAREQQPLSLTQAGCWCTRPPFAPPPPGAPERAAAMGSGRDKRKKAKPGAPGAGREKTERKTAAGGEKRLRRSERGAGEDDIASLLARARLDEEDAAATGVVQEAGVGRPSARCNATLTPSPLPRSTELLLYGGERAEVGGGRVVVFGELLRFCTAGRSWGRVRSPGAPPPRSAHSAVAHRHHLVVFGGEFTSPSGARAKRTGSRGFGGRRLITVLVAPPVI